MNLAFRNTLRKLSRTFPVYMEQGQQKRAIFHAWSPGGYDNR